MCLAKFLIGLIPFLTSIASKALAASAASVNDIPAETTIIPGNIISDREFWLTIIVVVFGIAVLTLEYLLLKSVVGKNDELISRTILSSLIIVGTLILIAAGLSSSSIAPAIGLFGTIAGYLLGRSDQRKVAENEKSQ